VWGFPISTVMALMPSCAAAPRNEPSGPVLLMAKGGELAHVASGGRVGGIV
jgi:hypothetical protein